MAQQIQLPDGSTREYADDVPDAQIEAELQREFPPQKETQFRFNAQGEYVGGFPAWNVDEVQKMIAAEPDPTRKQAILTAFKRYINREDQPTNVMWATPPAQGVMPGDPTATRSIEAPSREPYKIELRGMANPPSKEQGYIASPEDLKQAAAEQQTAPGAEFDPAKGMSAIEKLLVGAGGSFEKFNQYLEENWGGRAPPEVMAAMKDRLKTYEKYRKNLGLAGAIGEETPEMIASAIPISRAGRLLAGGARAVGAGRAAPLLGDIAANAAYAGGREALTGGDVVGGAARGAAGAGLGHVAGGLIQRGIGPIMNPSAQVLSRAGILPTWGQAIGPRAARIEHGLSQVFGLKGAIGGAQKQVLQDYGRAEVNQALRPLGREVKSFGEDAVVQANRIVDDAYDAAKSHVELPAFARSRVLRDAWTRVGRELPDIAPGSLDTVARIVRERIVRVGPNLHARLDGPTWKNIDRTLGEKIRDHSGGRSSAEDREIARALRIFQESWRNEVRPIRGASPRHVQDLRNADEAFRNLVPVEKAMHRATKDLGEFTPDQMAKALRQERRVGGTRAYPELNRAARELIEPGFGRDRGFHPYMSAGAYTLPWLLGMSPKGVVGLGLASKGLSHLAYSRAARAAGMRGLSGIPASPKVRAALHQFPLTGAEMGAQAGREKGRK
jgi:hypothetical protein